MKTFISICCTLLIAIVTLTNCSKDDDDKTTDYKNKLVGTWDEQSPDGFSHWTWIFRANGTCDLILRDKESGYIGKDLDNYSYAIEGEQVVIKGFVADEEIYYTIIMKILVLTDNQLKCSWRSPQWEAEEEDMSGVFIHVN